MKRRYPGTARLRSRDRVREQMPQGLAVVSFLGSSGMQLRGAREQMCYGIGQSTA